MLSFGCTQLIACCANTELTGCPKCQIKASNNQLMSLGWSKKEKLVYHNVNVNGCQAKNYLCVVFIIINDIIFVIEIVTFNHFFSKITQCNVSSKVFLWQTTRWNKWVWKKKLIKKNLWRHSVGKTNSVATRFTTRWDSLTVRGSQLKTHVKFS